MAAPSPRRRFQFRLRTLILAGMAVVGVVVSVLLIADDPPESRVASAGKMIVAMATIGIGLFCCERLFSAFKRRS
jgi:hypothetical protein